MYNWNERKLKYVVQTPAADAKLGRIHQTEVKKQERKVKAQPHSSNHLKLSSITSIIAKHTTEESAVQENKVHENKINNQQKYKSETINHAKHFRLFVAFLFVFFLVFDF